MLFYCHQTLCKEGIKEVIIIARNNKIITIDLSVFDSSILELRTAIVPQSNPKTIGRAPLPFNPKKRE